MSILKLQLDEAETYSDHSKQVFSILKDYLQPETESNLQSTATSLLAVLPKSSRESTEVWMFFELCIMLAEQIPYQHPLQLKLVGLMEYLCLSPQITSIFEGKASKNQSSGHFMLHSRLSGCMRDNLNGPNPEFPGEFVNLSAFAAHLLECRVLSDDPTWAIVALHDAHEGVNEERESGQQQRDELMVAAAQWILWYGQALFKKVLYPGEVDPQKLKGSWSTGKLYKGQGGLSMERWQFWKHGFSAVAAVDGGEKEGYGKEGYGKECTEVAARAASLMEAFEKAMTF